MAVNRLWRIKEFGRGEQDQGGSEFSPSGKLRTYQKHNINPGPLKVYSKEEIEEYLKKKEIKNGERLQN